MIIEGVVVSGKQLGRKLGFPTANIELNKDCSIENGVYVAQIWIDNRSYYGVANVGIQPTIGKLTKSRLEVHILNLDREIYNTIIKVKILKKLRDEMKFNSLDELSFQIRQDIDKCKLELSYMCEYSEQL